LIYTVTLNTAVDRTIEVPGLRIGGVFSGRTICEQPAGKGVNVSRCLATLGVESIVGGFVGAGELKSFESSFSGAPVRVQLIGVPGRTRRDTTLIDPTANSDTHIRESGYAVGAEHVEALRADLSRTVRSGDMVVFCGSLPAGISAEEFAGLLRHAKGLGCKVALDTSGEGLRRGLSARPFLMKPNRVELEELTSGDPRRAPPTALADVVERARPLLASVEMLMVSLGKDGAVLICPAGRWHAVCRLSPKEVKSTVGCGDASLAGLLAGLAQGRSAAECLRLGVACGSACALTPMAGLIHRNDVERLLSKTEISEL
jgi:1-phosphofructokinase family hexose kinase